MVLEKVGSCNGCFIFPDPTRSIRLTSQWKHRYYFDINGGTKGENSPVPLALDQIFYMYLATKALPETVHQGYRKHFDPDHIVMIVS